MPCAPARKHHDELHATLPLIIVARNVSATVVFLGPPHVARQMTTSGRTELPTPARDLASSGTHAIGRESSQWPGSSCPLGRGDLALMVSFLTPFGLTIARHLPLCHLRANAFSCRLDCRMPPQLPLNFRAGWCVKHSSARQGARL
jgi:hypothetical protein